MFRALLTLSAALLACPLSFAGPPGGIVVAASKPEADVPVGAIKVASGRFVPLNIAAGKPALVFGIETPLFDITPILPTDSIIGIRWNEPAGAKAKRYTFPPGATHVAVAGDTAGVVTLTAIVNGPAATEKVPEGPPSVAGTLVLEVTGARPPPPGPTPPDPGPTPPPGPVTSFRVIFVTESATVLSAAQNAVTGAKAVQAYLTSKTTPEGGWSGWRHYDPQTGMNDQPTMRALWAAVKPKITTVPCLVIEVNGKADILPFPANATEALATLKKYAGDK
jgi:hypothetical protein